MNDQTPTHILAIADDFTGANDVGMMFARQGFETAIELDSGDHFPALRSGRKQALVINTDSRSVPAHIACERVMQVAEQFERLPQPSLVYKKIDSTLRGNIGVEVETLLQQSSLSLAIIAPAFPDGQRVTIDGQCWVDGQLLTDTEFASDPKTPVHSSRISDILTDHTGLTYCHITLKDGVEESKALFDKARQDNLNAVIVDITTNEQLRLLGLVIHRLHFPTLCVGSAGLSQYLFPSASSLPLSSILTQKRPVLAVVGSMSRIAGEQIRVAVNSKAVQVVRINVTELFEQAWPALLERYEQQIAEAYQRQQHVVLHTLTPGVDRQFIEQFCQQKQLTRHQLGTQITRFLALLVSQLVTRHAFSGLYLSGGDTALATAQALHASHFYLKGDIAGFVPWGYLPDSYQPNLLIMTKSGAFGTPDTLLQVIEFIEEKTRE